MIGYGRLEKLLYGKWYYMQQYAGEIMVTLLKAVKINKQKEKNRSGKGKQKARKLC